MLALTDSAALAASSIGHVILPFGIASELVGKVGLGQSMLIAAGWNARLLRGLCHSEPVMRSTAPARE